MPIELLDVAGRVLTRCRIVFDESADASQIKVLVERQRRQQEIRKAAGSRFDALEPQCSRCRARYDALDVRVRVHERLQVALPVGQVLDLVQKQHPEAFQVAVRLADFVGSLLDREPRVQRLVERQVTKVVGPVFVPGEEMPDDVMQQHRLADPAWPHQHHGTTDAGLFHQAQETVEVRAWSQFAEVGTDCAVRPPWVFRPDAVTPLLRGDFTHAVRLGLPAMDVN